MPNNAPVARGYKTTCLLDFETSFGVAPDTPAARRLPINTFSLNVSRAKNSAATLTGRRDPVEPFDGNAECSGALTVPMDVRAFPWWLKLMFGEPVTTGTGEPAEAPYTHVFKPGDTGPSGIVQVTYGTTPETYGKFSGCKVSSLSIQTGGDGELTATVNLAGRSGEFSQTNYHADAVLVPMKRLNNFQAALKDGNAEIATVTQFDLTVDNGLDTSIRTLGSKGMVYDIPEGIMSVTGTMTMLFTGLTMLERAKNSTEMSLELAWEIDSSNKITIKLPEVQLQYQGPTVDGPTGVMAEYPFVAYHSDGADNACLVATVVNDVEAYV